ncbi:phosphohydrolase [Candidatus Peregrinibacteria bacterium CG_4_9_14_0_2_um_filter_53_11]|nr:MAG: phosphohydrolase [Candidatus Peregrinibacteria bacterium CG_4_9_14_0_2_um_filter_53_11]
MMSFEEALSLLREHVKTENIIKHLFATQVLMQALARKFGEDEHRWGLAGLLHDLDWDYTKPTPDRHGLMSFEMLADKDLDPEICSAIKLHNYMLDIEPQTLMEKALYCSEMMTGFIVAVALVKPSKKLDDVKVESVLKKFKEKSFASGARREIMERCEPYLGITLEELVTICLAEMKKISGKLGL